MSTMLPELICESTVSRAWARAFLMTMTRGDGHMPPLLLSMEDVANLPPSEDLRIRDALDVALDEGGKQRCANTAVTIFPYNYWRRTQDKPRDSLYSYYLDRFLPRARQRNGANQYGTYFERMIAFTGVKKKKRKDTIKLTNQVEHIVKEWIRDRARPKRPRQSALQLSCFDPAKDHTGQSVRGFPCLQQVSFSYQGPDMAVHAYYPVQYVFDRAYGNYLGLCHLGQFFAHELGLRFARLNVYVAHPQLGNLAQKKLGKRITKTGLRALANQVEHFLSSPPAIEYPNSDDTSAEPLAEVAHAILE